MTKMVPRQWAVDVGGRCHSKFDADRRWAPWERVEIARGLPFVMRKTRAITKCDGLPQPSAVALITPGRVLPGAKGSLNSGDGTTNLLRKQVVGFPAGFPNNDLPVGLLKVSVFYTQRP